MASKITTFSLAALCVLLAGALWWRTSAASVEQENLQNRVAALQRELAQQPKPSSGTLPAPQLQPAPPAISVPRVSTQQDRDSAISLAKANEDLAATRTRVSELELKVLSLEADRATITQARQQEAIASEETCRARVGDSQKALEIAQADLKATQQRVVLFESENENLRKAQATRPAQRVASSGDELDELSHRRDAYLKSVIRRYREIDTDYRSLLRDPASGRPNDAVLFRIQGTLSQAEDDLRQIDSLTAKTLLVEKKAR